MNILAVIVAVIATSFAMVFHIKMRGIDTRLKYQDFPHRKWDLENPVRELRWNSKGQPITIWESRELENSLRRTSKDAYENRGICAAIAVLAWITAFGF
jgi:hypothetical protein